MQCRPERAYAPVDFKSVIAVDPSNREALQYLELFKGVSHAQTYPYPIRYCQEPSYRRTPPEIWSRIASFIPRYHLRTWLSVSVLYREIALTRIFRAIDLFFGDDCNLHRGMDVFDRVKQDPRFANRIVTLRIHWSFEEGDMLEIMTSELIEYLNLNFDSYRHQGSSATPCRSSPLSRSLNGLVIPSFERKWFPSSYRYNPNSTV